MMQSWLYIAWSHQEEPLSHMVAAEEYANNSNTPQEYACGQAFLRYFALLFGEICSLNHNFDGQ